MAGKFEGLTDGQWRKTAPLIPEEPYVVDNVIFKKKIETQQKQVPPFLEENIIDRIASGMMSKMIRMMKWFIFRFSISEIYQQANS